MKNTLRNILSGVLFLAIGLGILLGVSRIFVPKQNLKDYGMLFPDADGIRGEQENTIDLVIVGDSESYWAFNPMHLWKETGITSYVCGTRAQRLYTTEEYVRLAFRSQKPKYVILETDAIYREYDLAEQLGSTLEQLLPVLRYHHRWRYLTEEDWNRAPAYTATFMTKGLANMVGNAQRADTSGYMAPSEDTQPIALLQKLKVRQIHRLCVQNDAELILVSVPSTVNWSMPRHNAVAALAKELGVPYLDLNCMPEEVPIDWEKDTWDGGDHMNLFGSEKVTSFCGRYFKEKGLPDHRGDPAYASWEADCGKYSEAAETIRRTHAEAHR